MLMKLAVSLIALPLLTSPGVVARPPMPQAGASPSSATASAQAQAASPGSPAAPSASQAGPLPEYPLPSTGAPDAMPRRYIEMWNTGNFRLLEGMFTPQPRLHSERLDSLAMPARLVVNRIKVWRNCMPDFNYQILDTISQGDKVVLRVEYSGTYEKQCYNDIPAPPPDAPPMKIRVKEILIFGLDHGMISDIWEEDDELRARLQMGAKWCDTPAQPVSAPLASSPSPAAAAPQSKP
jgi:predicted ester cyclase